MSGFRLRLSRLRNVPCASSKPGPTLETSFEVEYRFNSIWNWVVVRPIIVNTVVIFLINFPDGNDEPMALVYNKKDAWSDIEKESTGLAETIGAAIEQYYELHCTQWSDLLQDGTTDIWDSHLLN